MDLFVSFFAYFIEDYFSLQLNRFRCAFCTRSVGRVDPGRDDHSVANPLLYVLPARGGLPVFNLAYVFFFFEPS